MGRLLQHDRDSSGRGEAAEAHHQSHNRFPLTCSCPSPITPRPDHGTAHAGGTSAVILGMPGAAPRLLSHVALGYASDALIAALEDACCLGGASGARPAGPPPNDQQPLRWPRHGEQRLAPIPDAAMEDMEAVLPMVRGGSRVGMCRGDAFPPIPAPVFVTNSFPFFLPIFLHACRSLAQWAPQPCWSVSGRQSTHACLPACLNACLQVAGSVGPSAQLLATSLVGLWASSSETNRARLADLQVSLAQRMTNQPGNLPTGNQPTNQLYI